MKSITIEAARLWLGASGLILDQNLWIKEVERIPGYPFCFLVDGSKSYLSDLCRELWDWLPAGRERLLLVSDWVGYPPDHSIVFEALRKASGASASLEEAPGLLFVSTKDTGTHYEDRPLIDVHEESIASWLAGLMLQWEWNGYMAAKGCADAVFLGDGFVRFLSADPARLEAGAAICAGLKPSAAFPWHRDAN